MTNPKPDQIASADYIVAELLYEFAKILPASTSIRRVNSMGYYRLEFDVTPHPNMEDVLYVIEKIRAHSEDHRPPTRPPQLSFSAILEFPRGPRSSVFKLNFSLRNDMHSCFCKHMSARNNHCALHEILNDLRASLFPDEERHMPGPDPLAYMRSRAPQDSRSLAVGPPDPNRMFSEPSPGVWEPADKSAVFPREEDG